MSKEIKITSHFAELRNFLRSKPVGSFVSRQDLRDHFDSISTRDSLFTPKMLDSPCTVDNYRRKMVIAKLLDHTGRGLYKIQQVIPKKLNLPLLEKIIEYRELGINKEVSEDVTIQELEAIMYPLIKVKRFGI